MSRSVYFLSANLILNFILLSLLCFWPGDDLRAVLAQPGFYVLSLFPPTADSGSSFEGFRRAYYCLIFLNIVSLTILEVLILSARGRRDKDRPADESVEITSLVFDRDFSWSTYNYSIKSLFSFGLCLFLLGLILALFFSNQFPASELSYERFSLPAAWFFMPTAFFTFRVVFFAILRLGFGLAGKRLKEAPAARPATVFKSFQPVAAPFFKILLIILVSLLLGAGVDLKTRQKHTPDAASYREALQEASAWHISLEKKDDLEFICRSRSLALINNGLGLRPDYRAARAQEKYIVWLRWFIEEKGFLPPEKWFEVKTIYTRQLAGSEYSLESIRKVIEGNNQALLRLSQTASGQAE